VLSTPEDAQTETSPGIVKGNLLQKNLVKVKLQAGGRVYGTSLGDRLDLELPIILAAAGIDFFFIDTEHSSVSYNQIKGICRVARGAGVVPLVRVTTNSSALISRALDVGAMGIIVPRINSAAEARSAVDAMKFPPIGRRGYGLGSIVTDLKGDSAQDETVSANRETLVVLMIESQEGLTAVEEIAAVPEIDVLFIGPYDLSLSLGIIEQFEHPIFLKALERIVKAGHKAGLSVGLQSGNMTLLTRVREMGVRFLICGSDSSVLLEGYRKTVAAMKA
jgi:2-dehydro-3-deoxyglucarate aldolase/4-hydroxy-2-oxoheptanedioate aldolase